MTRSIMTPIDHADMMNSVITTSLASQPICFHIDTQDRSLLPALLPEEA